MSSATHVDAAIRRFVMRVAELDRASGTRGARTAASLLAAELELRGAAVRLEEERVHGTYWVPIGLACGFATAAAACAARRRPVATAGGALAAACVIDELEIGRRPLRRLLRRRTAVNVIAELAPRQAPTHTIVVHAHHDAAHTGLVFHPAIAKLTARVAGRTIERLGGTPAPMWGAALGPPLVALGAALRLGRLSRLGGALSAGYAAAMLDIARRPAVPGANDNLSGVAVLLILAEALARCPHDRLRVLLLSTGAEESFLEGMEAFAARHLSALPPDTTTFLCVESVGSPELMVLDGEGLLRLHRYPRDLVRRLARLADEAEIPRHEPLRYRLATDGQIPLRAGYATAVISSIDWYKAPSNYHWPSDRPENLCWGTIARAAQLAAAFIADLDRSSP